MHVVKCVANVLEQKNYFIPYSITCVCSLLEYLWEQLDCKRVKNNHHLLLQIFKLRGRAH